ncbi:TBC1 domain family member 22B-like isoform X2 [Anneissia japonica]|uniref:TBC1 domain family member 22B-like isoform X2 n=1 Tax=Anneissia japonica TaxID=1529436 RepID=UPI001425A605|nr:TBC1 domain family member 22B-like isoform X2 [Anneissia japonica]
MANAEKKTSAIGGGFGNISEPKKKTYWKKGADKVPGSMRPVYSAKYGPEEIAAQTRLRDHTSTKSKKKNKDPFTEFDQKMDDAWDVNEDEINTFAHSNQAVQESGRQQIVIQHEIQNERVHDTEQNVTDITNSKSPVTSQTSIGSNDVTINEPRPTSPIRMSSKPVAEVELTRQHKFGLLLAGPNTDLEELRKLSWKGIPKHVRPMTWKILLGYLPANIDRRDSTLERKREEYFSFIEQYYHTRTEPLNEDMFRQIHIDIPRTNPLIPLFQQALVQEIFERILYIWAIRHPASGYVQGINDLVTPFFVVFLSEFLGDNVKSIESYDVKQLDPGKLRVIEADTFWCMSKLLDGIQDNYTFAQPGIQKKVKQLENLIKRINAHLQKHLEHNLVEYLQFSYRWMNNLLMRELPLNCTIRVWDTYMSEPDGFAEFHLYVCAAFLQRFSKEILEQKDFQGILLLLQNLPTSKWGENEIGLLLAEAYSLKYVFSGAQNHLTRSK